VEGTSVASKRTDDDISSTFVEGTSDLEAIECAIPKTDHDALKKLCLNAVADRFYQESAKVFLGALVTFIACLVLLLI
ncbi:hypothetical protein U1Q18_049771, partial [Sarracenia purpurea var. burkii]